MGHKKEAQYDLDIYRHVPCYGTEWYVKYFLDENGPVITIWSLKEDGYQF